MEEKRDIFFEILKKKNDEFDYKKEIEIMKKQSSIVPEGQLLEDFLANKPYNQDNNNEKKNDDIIEENSSKNESILRKIKESLKNDDKSINEDKKSNIEENKSNIEIKRNKFNRKKL